MSLLEALLDLVFGHPRHPLYRNRIADAWRALRCRGELFYAAPRAAAAGGGCLNEEFSRVEVFCPNGDEQCGRCPRFHGYRKSPAVDLQISTADLRELELLNGNSEGAAVAHREVEAVAAGGSSDKSGLDKKSSLVAPPALPGVEDAEGGSEQGDAEGDGLLPIHERTSRLAAGNPEVKR